MSTQPGFTVWLTGRPNAGKTTLGLLLQKEMAGQGRRVEFLDGGLLRLELYPDLGFTPQDRRQHALRTTFIASMLNRHQVDCVVAQIAPYQDLRSQVRARLPRYLEVYMECSLESAINRDRKDIYRRALAGEIKGFTGLDDPWQPPDDAEVICPTDQEDPQASLKRVLSHLEAVGFLPPSIDDQPPETDPKVKRHLRNLGYI